MKFTPLCVFLLVFATDFVTSTKLRVQLSDRDIVIDTNLRENWFGADRWCRRHGMQLLIIRSIEENEEITKFIQREGLTRIWTAGNDLHREGEWRWTGVTTFERILIDRWMSNEPNNHWWDKHKEHENCLELYNHNVKNWNDATCRASQLLFICETLLY